MEMAGTKWDQQIHTVLGDLVETLIGGAYMRKLNLWCLGVRAINPLVCVYVHLLYFCNCMMTLMIDHS
jgi:hypothetical protein